MGKIKYLSVCSGIEAASVGWHGLEWEPVAFAEIDPFASSILAPHYPEVPNLGDFTKIGVEHVGSIDVLVGGTPCQSFSVAGLRGGLGDERGNLALEFLRLADRLRPRWVVWENVPGVLSSTSHISPDPCPPTNDLEGPDGPCDGEEIVVEDEYDSDEDHAFSCFLAGLSELGYGYAYGTLDAQHFGVPQRRRRIFVVGHLGDWRGPAAVLFDWHCLSGHPAPSRAKRESSTYDISPSIGASGRGFERAGDSRGGGLPDSISGTLGGGGKRGWSNDLDRSGAFIPEVVGTLSDGSHYGGGVTDKTPIQEESLLVPSVTSKWAKGTGGPSGDECQNLVAVGGFFDQPTHSLRAEGFDASEDGTGRGTPLVPVAFDTTQITSDGNYSSPHPGDPCHPLASGAHPPCIAFDSKASGRNGFGVGENSPTLRSMNADGGHDNGGRQVAIAFRAAGQDGFTPSSVCPPMASTDGGGAGVPTVAFNLRGREGGAMAEMASLRASSGGSSRTYVGQMRVRRLTPKECERLQGFKDNWTKINSKTADGPRYRVIGNSMATVVMKWLGERIDMVDKLQ